MRQYRLVRLAGLHYVGEELYRDNPHLRDLSYAQQQQWLFSEAYVYSNGISAALGRMGHEIHEIVYDLKPMQETWVRENGVRYNPESWKTEIAFRQIESLRPDVLYIQGSTLPYPLYKQLKKMFPFLKLVVVHRGFPGAYKELAAVDLLLIGMPSMVRRYRQEGVDAQLVYHAFDDRIHDKLDAAGYTKSSYECDFSYIGSSGFGHQSHANRYWDLLGLFEKTDIRMWLDEQQQVQVQTRNLLRDIGYSGNQEDLAMALVGLTLIPADAEDLRKKLAILPEKIQSALQANRNRQGYPLKSLGALFPNRVHPPVFGLRMYDLMRRSKISFNNHMSQSWGSVGNLRMYEATGMGTCLLTDTGDNIRDLFEPDREVVTYSSMDECVEKVRYLLDHDDVRRQIGIAGQKRTLRDHTMNNRAQQVDSMIQGLLNRGTPIQSIPRQFQPQTSIPSVV